MTSTASSLRGMVYASMFGALTAVGAMLSIPLYPVPITLQNLFTFLAGLLLGGYYGALSQVVYVLLGVIGVPVFGGGKAGLGVLLGPTGGYLFGFILGAYVIGKIAQVKPSPGVIWLFMAVVVGDVVIYAVGITQLSFVAGLGVRKALVVGFLPFVIGDSLKCLVAALLATKIRNQPFWPRGFEST